MTTYTLRGAWGTLAIGVTAQRLQPAAAPTRIGVSRYVDRRPLIMRELDPEPGRPCMMCGASLTRRNNRLLIGGTKCDRCLEAQHDT